MSASNNPFDRVNDFQRMQVSGILRVLWISEIALFETSRRKSKCKRTTVLCSSFKLGPKHMSASNNPFDRVNDFQRMQVSGILRVLWISEIALFETSRRKSKCKRTSRCGRGGGGGVGEGTSDEWATGDVSLVGVAFSRLD